MLRGTMLVDEDGEDGEDAEAEAKLSESPPVSSAQRKRARTNSCSRESSGAGTSPQYNDRKMSPKRAKVSEEGGVGEVGTSPYARTQASVAEAARRGAQHVGLGQTNLAGAPLQSTVDEAAAAAAGASAMDRQRLLLQELMTSQDSNNFSLLGAQQQPSTSHARWGAAPAMTLGGSNVGLFNQQAAPDLAQFLQLRALNQLSLQGYQTSGMTGLGGLSMGMNGGMNGGMNAYGMPFLDQRQSMLPVGHELPGMGPYRGFLRNPAPSLATMRAGLGGSADIPFREMYGGAGLPGGLPPMNNQNMIYAMTQARGVMPPAAGVPTRLPCILAQPEDNLKLSEHQVQLRHQIEAFQATDDDVSTHTRGRNKPIILGQVGIRCRHCSHMPVCRRKKGSTYFPATLLGLYQAAQNMSTTHMQCGLCTEMPEAIKIQFTSLLTSKAASSGAGRPYWAQSAKKLGLVDTEDGIFCSWDLPAGVRIIRDDSS